MVRPAITLQQQLKIRQNRGRTAMEQSKPGAGEMAPQMRALTALIEDLDSVPGTHMAAYKHL